MDSHKTTAQPQPPSDPFSVMLGLTGSYAGLSGNPSSNTQSHSQSHSHSQQTHSQSQSDLQCMVCMQPTCSTDSTCSMYTLACGHAFHSHCISMWLDHHSMCPTCNRIVAAITRVQLRQYMDHDTSTCGSNCHPKQHQQQQQHLQFQHPQHPQHPHKAQWDLLQVGSFADAGSRWMLAVTAWILLVAVRYMTNNDSWLLWFVLLTNMHFNITACQSPRCFMRDSCTA